MKHDGRIPGLDLVRCVAIFLVVLQHSWTMLDLDLQQGTIQFLVYSSVIYGVPLFVMLSGALNLRRMEAHGAFFRKRIPRVLIPFLIWGTFTYAISCLMGKYSGIDSLSSALKMYVPYVMTAKINEAYWYVYLILSLYLVTPLLQRVFCRGSKLSSPALALSVAIWFGVETAGLCHGLAGLFVLYLGYYLLGGLIMRLLLDGKIRFGIGVAGSIVFLALNIWLNIREQGCFAVGACETVSFFLLLSGIDFGSSLTFNLSRYSYFVYLTHFIIIRALYLALPGVFVPVWYMPIVAALLVLGIEYVVCRAFECFGHAPLKILGI